MASPTWLPTPARSGLLAVCLVVTALPSACGGASVPSQPSAASSGASPLGIVSPVPSDPATPDASASDASAAPSAVATAAATANATPTAATSASPSPQPTPTSTSLPGPDYLIDETIGWFHFTALKCGTPAGRWDLMVEGERNLGGGSLVLTGAGTVDLDAATSTGPWQAEYVIDLVGVPSAIGGQEGTVTGVAALDGSVLSITGQTGAGDFWSQTPALALAGAAGDPTRDFELHVQGGDFC